MKVGAVEEYVLVLGITQPDRRILVKPIVLDLFKLEGAVSGELGKLKNGVALTNP